MAAHPRENNLLFIRCRNIDDWFLGGVKCDTLPHVMISAACSMAREGELDVDEGQGSRQPHVTLKAGANFCYTRQCTIQ